MFVRALVCFGANIVLATPLSTLKLIGERNLGTNLLEVALNAHFPLHCLSKVINNKGGVRGKHLFYPTLFSDQTVGTIEEANNNI